MARVRTRPGGKPRRKVTLSLDQALIALFIGAMTANGRVAPLEAARAHHLIWSTRRFRRKSGEAVGRLIEETRDFLEEDPEAVMRHAARTIPAPLRTSAFAVVTDLLLADGKMDAQERRFLRTLGVTLGMRSERVRLVLEVMLLKNQL